MVCIDDNLPNNDNMITNTYTHGETITLTAMPDVCCEFLYWVDSSNPCVPLSYEREFSVPAAMDVTYLPVFRKRRFMVDVTTNLPNYCCITGNGWHDCGDDVTVTITTAACNGFSWSDAALNRDTTVRTVGNVKTLTYVIEDISDDFEGTMEITLCMCSLSVETCRNHSTDSSVVILTASNTPNHNSREYICEGRTSNPVNPCDYEDVVIHRNTLLAPCGTEVTLIATPKSDFNGWKYGTMCSDCSHPSITGNNVYTFVLENNTDLIACFD